MIVLGILTVLVLAVALVQGRFLLQRRRFARLSWDSIFAKIQTVNIQGLREIADCYLKPDKDQLRIEPDQMWRIAGGLDGLSRLHTNTEAMLDLAMFAERWNDENGRVISEMMRRDARRIRKAVTRVQLSSLTRLGLVKAPLHLQEAISSYCLMRGRLLGLYALGHAGLLPKLEGAL